MQKAKMRESVPPSSAKPCVGGILNFFGPNPIIPPRPKKAPLPVTKPNLTGRGKRQAYTRRGDGAGHGAQEEAAPELLPRPHGHVQILRACRWRPPAAQRRCWGRWGASLFVAGEGEYSSPVGGGRRRVGVGAGASDQSMQVNMNDPADIMEFDLTEFPDVVEQEDGYISPSPSDSREADELSSPPQAGRTKARHQHHAQQGVSSSFSAPPTGFLLSDDEEDDAENSFGADIVSSPISVKRPMVHKPRAYVLNTSTQVSTPRGSGHVLVQPSPSPANGRTTRAEVRRDRVADTVPRPGLTQHAGRRRNRRART